MSFVCIKWSPLTGEVSLNEHYNVSDINHCVSESSDYH